MVEGRLTPGLVRRLPLPVKRRIARTANYLRTVLERQEAIDAADLQTEQLIARLPRRSGRRYAGTRVVVAGLFGVRCGLQRGAELMVRDLEARGVDVMAFDVTGIVDHMANLRTDVTGDPARVLAWAPTDLVVHVNPPLFARVFRAFPPDTLRQLTVIGFWVWELPVLPASWRPAAGTVDEIWAPSPFVADAARAGLPGFSGPIRVVPHAVDRDPMPAVPARRRDELRARLGLPARSFVVGTSFSFDSNYARKNPCGAIDAFRAAFRAGEPAGLVVRCHEVGRNRRLFDHLVSYAGGDGRVVVWNVEEAALSMPDFYGLIDAYVSLHRSEGYGLNMAEAAQAGLPVVATGWGLAPDIASRPEVTQVRSRLVVPLDTQKVYERYPGAVWAEPDVLEAAEVLRSIYAMCRERALSEQGAS